MGGKVTGGPVAGSDLGFGVDCAADGFLAREPEMADLCRELGLGADLVPLRVSCCGACHAVAPQPTTAPPRPTRTVRPDRRLPAARRPRSHGGRGFDARHRPPRLRPPSPPQRQHGQTLGTSRLRRLCELWAFMRETDINANWNPALQIVMLNTWHN